MPSDRMELDRRVEAAAGAFIKAVRGAVESELGKQVAGQFQAGLNAKDDEFYERLEAKVRLEEGLKIKLLESEENSADRKRKFQARLWAGYGLTEVDLMRISQEATVPLPKPSWWRRR